MGAWWQMNYVNYWNNIKILIFVFVGNKEDQMKCEWFVFIWLLGKVVAQSAKWFRQLCLGQLFHPGYLWGGWDSSPQGLFICTARCCSFLGVAILWRTTHATIMSHVLSGVTLSLRGHWYQALSMPIVISTRALVWEWATLKHCWGPGSGSG